MYERYHDRLWGLFGLKRLPERPLQPNLDRQRLHRYRRGDHDRHDRESSVPIDLEYFHAQRRRPQRRCAEARFVADSEPEPCYFYYVEAENFNSTTGITGTNSLVVENHAAAWSLKTLQIGPYVGNAATYTVRVGSNPVRGAFFQARYSDNVPGNVLDVYVNGTRKGSFDTQYSGNWDMFIWDNEHVGLGLATPGTHAITLRIADGGGGSYGVNLDVFRVVTQCNYLPLLRWSSPLRVSIPAPVPRPISVTGVGPALIQTRAGIETPAIR